MRVIYKYPVQVMESFEVFMPAEAQILDVQTQDGDPVMWCLVDTDKEIETRKFLMLGTGHMVPTGIENSLYVGTFQLLGGKFIGHLFEILGA